MLISSAKHKKQNVEQTAFNFLIYLETIPVILGMLVNKENSVQIIKHCLA